MSGTPFVLAASGLAFEAAIARGSEGIRTCCGQGQRLVEALEASCDERCAGIISFGIAAGLDPALRPGTVLVASAVLCDDGPLATDPAWSARLRARCRSAAPAVLVGVDRPIPDAHEKTRLFETTGARALDMETHVAARFAAGRNIRFAALRVVADPAERNVPEAALRAVRADGTANVPALVRGLLRRPGALAPVMRLAVETQSARRSLLGARRCLGPGFGLLDLG